MAIHPILWLVLALAVGDAGAPPSSGEAAATGSDTRFARAFDPALDEAARRVALERIVKESPDSEWADDALWALGEAAREKGQSRQVAYYWQYLMAVHPEPRLEEFTQSLPLYQRSGLPQVEMFVRGTGQSYVHCDGRSFEGEKMFVDAKPFSAVPMLVWAGLGQSYEQMGKLRLSQKAFEQAGACAPSGGQWRANYTASAERVGAKLAQLGEAQKPPGTQAAGQAPAVALTPPPAPGRTSTNPGGEGLDRAKPE
jgi:hypothetical protein